MQKVKDIKTELQKWAEALDKAFKDDSEDLMHDFEAASRRVEIACDLLSAELADIESNIEESDLSSSFKVR